MMDPLKKADLNHRVSRALMSIGTALVIIYIVCVIAWAVQFLLQYA